MTLTAEALILRRTGIGGSDARKIVDGDWHPLWLDKTLRSVPEDLSRVWPVQLGILTESLNLDWYAYANRRPVTRRGEVVVSKVHPILRCTLDGWDAEENTVIQAKHCGGFQRIEEIAERYQPQVLHEILVTGAAHGILSVIIGANEPVRVPIEPDAFWFAEYVDRCHEFWRYVSEDKEPPGGPVPLPPPIPLDEMKAVDMTGNNEWGAFAADWLTNRDAAAVYEKAAKGLKGLVGADVREASGNGVVAKRDKRGLSIKEMKP